MNIELSKALRLAERIKGELLQFCDEIEIAVSIRRRRPNVNDIDLVVLPKAGQDLVLRTRAKQAVQTKVLTDAPQTLVIELANGIQVDVWIARQPGTDFFKAIPTNFGTLFLMRTGSKEHNVFLLEHAKRLGLRWNPYYGVFDGRGNCLAAETEREVFQALKLDFVEPERRER